VERGVVGEEAQGVEQTVGEDGAVEGVREVAMSAVAEVKDRRTGPAGVWCQPRSGASSTCVN
jgi:hypothetical protein